MMVGMLAIGLAFFVLLSISYIADNSVYGQDLSASESEAYKELQDEAEKREKAEAKEKVKDQRQQEKEKTEKEKKQEKHEVRQKIEEKRKELREKDIEKAEKIAKQQKETRERILEKLYKHETVSPEKTDKIQERLIAKIEKLNEKTASILEKIKHDRYLGPKFGDTSLENNGLDYLISFTDVDAAPIAKNNTDLGLGKMHGNVTLATYDKRNQSAKFEVTNCELVLGDIPYGCGFGKARIVSLQDSMKNSTSLVLIAFLEDAVENQIHSTLKLFIKTNATIDAINSGTENTFSVLGPQSVVSHQYFLNGTGTLRAMDSDFSLVRNGNNMIATNDTDNERIDTENLP